jgi:hypothetical protein
MVTKPYQDNNVMAAHQGKCFNAGDDRELQKATSVLKMLGNDMGLSKQGGE